MRHAFHTALEKSNISVFQLCEIHVKIYKHSIIISQKVLRLRHKDQQCNAVYGYIWFILRDIQPPEIRYMGRMNGNFVYNIIE
jgi:hypothetical protein